MRKRYFRGYKVKLECGHVVLICTSFYRLARHRLAVLYGGDFMRGVFCLQCEARCQVEEFLGTCRVEEAPRNYVDRGKPGQLAMWEVTGDPSDATGQG